MIGKVLQSQALAATLTGRLIFLAAAVWLMHSEASGAPEPPAKPVAPSFAASTAPAASASAPTSVPSSPPALTVAEARALTAEERDLLDAVTDGDDQWSSTGLYILLHRADLLPPGEEAYDAADRPEALTFWSAPAKYRGKLVAVEGVYAGRFDAHEAPACRWWQGGKYYLVPIKVSGAPDAVMIAVTQPPPGNLRLGARVRAAGFFYKTVLWPVSETSGNPTERRVYPVLVGRSLLADAGGLRARLKWPGVLGAVLGLAVILVLLRIWLRFRRRTGGGPLPLKDQPPADETEDFEVDPELQRQVELHQARTAEEDSGGKDRKGKA